MNLGSLRSLPAALRPAAVHVDARERWRAAGCAALGMVVTALICRALAVPLVQSVWLVAPLGASAVLIFAVPASPLAQPWAVVGGNTLSALVGIACSQGIADVALASAAAVGLAILFMFLLRCLHPPGGAAALLMVLNHVSSYRYALFPVLVDSLLLVCCGVLLNQLTRRRYPHAQRIPDTLSSRFTTADLDAALDHYNQVLDVSPDDLAELLNYAEASAYQRSIGQLRCREVMSQQTLSADYAMPLQEAWSLMRERRIKALPVVDRARRIIGIVTVADFMQLADLDQHDGLGDRLRRLLRGLAATARPQVVGEIMTRQVRVIGTERPVLELIPLFSEAGHHHIPAVDAEQRLAGMITQSDLVRALYRSVR